MTAATVEAPTVTTAPPAPANLPAIVREDDHGLAVINSDASLMMNPAVFEHMQRVCKVYAASDVVPQQFRGNLPNCMIAYELAHRMRVNVFMLMQAMYVVGGKPGLEAKLVIALVNERGPFRGPIQFAVEYDQKKSPIACTAYATLKCTGDRVETRVTWDVVEREGWASKSGSKWRTMPEQMFKYRSAAWLARTYCPEVIMGMHTTDELEDTYGERRYIQSTADESPASKLTQRLAASDPAPAAVEAEADAPAEEVAEPAEAAPASSADSDAARAAYQPLIDLLAEKSGKPNADAEAKLAKVAKALFKGTLDKLTDEQRSNLRGMIERGDITV